MIQLFFPQLEYFSNINVKEIHPISITVFKENINDSFSTYFIFLENVLSICNKCSKQLESSDVLIVEVNELINTIKIQIGKK